MADKTEMRGHEAANVVNCRADSMAHETLGQQSLSGSMTWPTRYASLLLHDWDLESRASGPRVIPGAADHPQPRDTQLRPALQLIIM